MSKTNSVAVLMSTYNGEKYLREQLESIFNQQGVFVKLFVRDDGSTDKTIDIIKEYKERYPITLMIDGENIGPGESFMRLLYRYYAEAEYIAFADQDDVWLKDKLSIAISSIQELEAKIPVLYCSNQIIFKNGKEMGVRFKNEPDLSLIGHISQNMISGCTFVMNDVLADLICNSEHAGIEVIRWRIHDAWTILVAIACGKVIYDQNAYILYRIHETNTVGIPQDTIPKYIAGVIQLIGGKKSGLINLRSNTCRQLLRSFPAVSGRNRELLEELAFYNMNWTNKLKLLRDSEVKEDEHMGTLRFKIRVLFNLI